MALAGRGVAEKTLHSAMPETRGRVPYLWPARDRTQEKIHSIPWYKLFEKTFKRKHPFHKYSINLDPPVMQAYRVQGANTGTAAMLEVEKERPNIAWRANCKTITQIFGWFLNILHLIEQVPHPLSCLSCMSGFCWLAKRRFSRGRVPAV